MTGIENLLNGQLVARVIDDEDSTEMERELADRLRASIEEIEQLVAEVRRLQAQEIVRGNET